MNIAGIAQNLLRHPAARRMVLRRMRVQMHEWLRPAGSIPAFLHIPKTGGTFIARFGQKEPPSLWPVRYLGHTLLGMPRGGLSPSEWGMMRTGMESAIAQRYFVFTSCRNPFDLLVSYHSYMRSEEVSRDQHKYPDFAIADRPFGEFVQVLADRESPWPSRKPLHMQMFDMSSGQLVVRWVLRTESLEQDLEGLAADRKCALRLSRTPARRSKRNKDYRGYYDGATAQLVEQTWGDELRLLGYGFDGANADAPGLRGCVTPEQQRSVRYDPVAGSIRFEHSG